MSKRVPSLDRERLFIGDGGLETTMIFDEGIELPLFASFLLLEDPATTEALVRYHRRYVDVAHRHKVGFALNTPTWRANPDWGEKLGYSAARLDDVNRRAVELAERLRTSEEDAETPIAVCGTIGPRGDAYHPAALMSADDAERYHGVQIRTFADAAVDMVGAYTLAYAEEAIGVVRAAASAGAPVMISFTVETDGRLPSGQPLNEAIAQVDSETGNAADYFMINCAHPIHVAAALAADGQWLDRLGGIRVNASRKSHAELDSATELDAQDPAALAADFAQFRSRTRRIRVVGGCCGTDDRHLDRICSAWLS